MTQRPFPQPRTLRALSPALPPAARPAPADFPPGTAAGPFDPELHVPLFRRAALVYNDTRYLDYPDALDRDALARETSFIAY